MSLYEKRAASFYVEQGVPLWIEWAVSLRAIPRSGMQRGVSSAVIEWNEWRYCKREERCSRAVVTWKERTAQAYGRKERCHARGNDRYCCKLFFSEIFVCHDVSSLPNNERNIILLQKFIMSRWRSSVFIPLWKYFCIIFCKPTKKCVL